MFVQFTNLVAKQQFSMKLEGRGRACVVKVGDVFTISNPPHMQDKGIKVMRSKLAKLNQGYLLSIEHIGNLFTVQI